MRQASYFRRLAGLVEGPTIRPPRVIFGSLPSAAEPAVIRETPLAAPLQQPMAPGEQQDVRTSSETQRIKVIHPPAAQSKVQLVEASLETPSQPASPKTPAFPAMRKEPSPAASQVFSAPQPTPVAPPSREGFRQAEWTVEASGQVPPPDFQTVQDREMPTPIQPPLKDTAAPKKLSRPTPITSVALRGREAAEKTAVSQKAVREFQAPRRVEPPALREGRGKGKEPAEHTGASGGSVHIGSLEIKIAPPPPTPPSKPAPVPVPSPPAVSRKTISREFRTFGAAQSY
jgi:hypothetical protein